MRKKRGGGGGAWDTLKTRTHISESGGNYWDIPLLVIRDMVCAARELAKPVIQDRLMSLALPTVSRSIEMMWLLLYRMIVSRLNQPIHVTLKSWIGWVLSILVGVLCLILIDSKIYFVLLV